ncbi:uncharacterized protein LOC135074276 [Ostrinia nubilalis]|uniref:uncharacterized protein LOC135074276 n=1 Tax=Ostrinia nubilalis TaxID=29057 RepID=UPI0030822F7B
MSRGTAFVVGYSVVLLGLFGLCCYLMSTVNPKPLDELNTTDERPHDRRGYDMIPYPDDKDIFRTDDEDHLGYGLDKAKGNKALKVDQSVSHLIPLYRHLLRKGAFVNSSLVQDVVPPIIPSMQRTSTTTQRSVVIRKPKTNTTNPIAVKYPPVKGLRRSVNAIETNSIKDEESSGVILKIIDDSGRPRIEIKLGPNGSFEGNKLRYHRSSENETKSDVHDSNVTSHADEYDESNNKNTIIKILPNNTMVFEKVDHSLVSFNVVKERPLGTEDYNVKNNSLSHDGDNSNSSHSNKVNFEEIILLVKAETPKKYASNVPLMNETGIYTLKMLIDNETKSIHNVVKNTGSGNDTFKNESLLLFDEKKNVSNFKNTKSNERNWHNVSKAVKLTNLAESNEKNLQVL